MLLETGTNWDKLVFHVPPVRDISSLKIGNIPTWMGEWRHRDPSNAEINPKAAPQQFCDLGILQNWMFPAHPAGFGIFLDSK